MFVCLCTDLFCPLVFAHADCLLILSNGCEHPLVMHCPFLLRAECVHVHDVPVVFSPEESAREESSQSWNASSPQCLCSPAFMSQLVNAVKVSEKRVTKLGRRAMQQVQQEDQDKEARVRAFESARQSKPPQQEQREEEEEQQVVENPARDIVEEEETISHLAEDVHVEVSGGNGEGDGEIEVEDEAPPPSPRDQVAGSALKASESLSDVMAAVVE